jgi:hypothetical protein
MFFSDCGFSEDFNTLFSKSSKVSWGDLFVFVVLSIVTYLIVVEIKNTITGINEDNERKASFIAVLIGLMLTIFFFWQPILKSLFENYTSKDFMTYIFIGSSGAVGWIVWYLAYLKKYGDFFYILLLTSSAGFCWYSRINGTSQIEMTAFSFVSFSLAHIAFMYIERTRVKRK